MAQSRRKGRPGAALLVSVAVHGVVLILLARAIPILPATAPGRDVQIDLVSALPLTRLVTPVSRALSASPQSIAEAASKMAQTRATPQRHPASARPAQAHPTKAPAPPHALPASRPVASEARPTPSAPTPARSSPAASAAATTAPRASAASHSDADASMPQEATGGVRKFLRETVGCSHQDFAHLSVAERFECERQNGVQAAIGTKQKLDALPANKRAYYDAVQQAYRAMHDYQPLDEGVGGQGAHMPGHGLNYSCVHGKCGLNMPEGAGTEESGVTPPQ